MKPEEKPLGDPKLAFEETSDLRAVVRGHFLGGTIGPRVERDTEHFKRFAPEQRPVIPEGYSAPLVPRPMIGFWATLTPEQQKAALAYDGPDNFGDPNKFRPS